jgi:hypothetical protein
MSFIKRRIDVKMALDGDTFDGSNNTISVTGLKCNLTVNSYAGSINQFASDIQLAIYGMRPSDMAKLSTLGFNSGSYAKNLIDVYAGDDLSGMSHVFNGGITSGVINYNGQPEVGVNLVASASASMKFAKVAATSYKGAMQVTTMIEGICQVAQPPLRFLNAGVTAVLRDHAVGGSTDDQIRDICLASKTLYAYDWADGQKRCVIWPMTGQKNDQVLDLSAATGMVGYPCYSVIGLDVKSLFNPNIEVGRLIKVSSTIPKPTGSLSQPGFQAPGANGTYYTCGVQHMLDSETPDGQWFTQAQLTSHPDNAR